ncbi:MAG: carboxypeptidase regulatory-like domain-containing protein [Acidobacteriota bacterium]
MPEKLAQGRVSIGCGNGRSLRMGAVVLLASLCLLPAGNSKEREPKTKSIRGHVTDRKKSVSGAKVFIKNLKRNTTTVVLTDETGIYSIYGLELEPDYEVHAEHKGLASETRTVSKFLKRYDNVVNLELLSADSVKDQRRRGSTTEENVELTTSDGIRLQATWHPAGQPQEEKKAAAVLLIHDVGEESQVWQGFVESSLFRRNYAILSLELRSHGSSRMEVSASDENARLFQPDVEAALNWLKGRDDVDTSRIAVLGSGLGGSLAFWASGKYELVRSAVVLSGRLGSAEQLKSGVSNFQPHSILYLDGNSGAEGLTVLQQFEKWTGFPVRIQQFQSSDSRGAHLLLDSPEAAKAVLDWLENNL